MIFHSPLSDSSKLSDNAAKLTKDKKSRYKPSKNFTYTKHSVEEVKYEKIINKNCNTEKVILMIHGGGFKIELNDFYRRLAEKYSKMFCGATVINVDYGRFPEHQLPSQMHDVVKVYLHLIDEGINNYLYGTHGAALNIKNLIPTITLTLGISAIPVLSAAWERKDKTDIKKAIETVLRVTMMIAMPAGLGIAAIPGPILEIIYSSQPEMIPIAAPMLRVYGIGIFLFAATSPMTNMLQAVGRMDIPIKSIAVGSCAKILLNFILIGNPEININGAPVSTTVCYIIIFVINLTSLLRVTKVKIDFISVYIKPFVSAAACGITAWGVNYVITEKLMLQSRIFTVVAIGAAAVVYAVLMLILKGIVKDDVEMLPKGEKIAKILAKFGLLG